MSIAVRVPQPDEIDPVFLIGHEAFWISTENNASEVPLIVSNPHAGRLLPDHLKDIVIQDGLNIEGSYIKDGIHEMDRRGDTFTDWISMAAQNHGATQITSSIAPAYINVGRNLDSISPADVRDWKDGGLTFNRNDKYVANSQGQGLVATRTLYDSAWFYKEGRHPSVQQILYRIDKYYKPFHNKLDAVAAATAARHKGYLPLIFDVHSCPSISQRLGEIKPDIILSDADGKSCHPAVMEAAARICEEHGFKVARNDPYKGGFITQKFGMHAERGTELGTQALQIEFNRRLFMDEETLEIKDPQEFARCQALMNAMIPALIEVVEANPT